MKRLLSENRIKEIASKARNASRSFVEDLVRLAADEEAALQSERTETFNPDDYDTRGEVPILKSPNDKLQSTPRTDAFFEEVGTMGPITHNVRWQDFARQLERELADEKRLNAGLIEGISAHKAELAKLQQSATAPKLPEMFKWWRDRFDDIEDDARTLMKSAPQELHGAIEGIRVVAEQGRDGMERLSRGE